MAKAAKVKATKLPKRVAGVKIPKALRESSGKMADWVRHPLVADLAAAGLLAVAAALKNNKAVRDTADKARKKAGGAASEVGQTAAALGAVIAAQAAKRAKAVAKNYEGIAAGTTKGAAARRSEAATKAPAKKRTTKRPPR